MTKLYEAPDYELLVLNSTDVVTASGDNWSNEPDYEDDPGEDGGVDAGGQLGDDFWG